MREKSDHGFCHKIHALRSNGCSCTNSTPVVINGRTIAFTHIHKTQVEIETASFLRTRIGEQAADGSAIHGFTIMKQQYIGRAMSKTEQIDLTSVHSFLDQRFEQVGA